MGSKRMLMFENPDGIDTDYVSRKIVKPDDVKSLDITPLDNNRVRVVYGMGYTSINSQFEDAVESGLKPGGYKLIDSTWF